MVDIILLLRRQKHLQRCTRSSGNYNQENTIDSYAYAVKINNYMINIIRNYN